MSRLSGFEGMSGDDWQDLCLRVLHEYHAAPELIAVPDDDRGDAGLEAFTLGGHAYQCYAPEGEPLSSGQRYNKQRDKITQDVNKFINNGAKIQALLPPDLMISRWILLVPYLTSRRLLEHAARATERLRLAALPYADAEITVVPQTLDAFEGAKAAVVNRQLHKLRLPPVGSADFSGLDDGLIGTMHDKLKMTSRFADPERRDVFVNRLLGNYVHAQAHRAHIGDHYSELGDRLEEELTDLEDRLVVQYALTEDVPDRRLNTVLLDTERVVDEILNTRNTHSRVIAEGQVADWLMRCPLDFT